MFEALKADLAGEVTGNAQALAMALAMSQKECNFEPKIENMNYRVPKHLRATFKQVWW